MNELHDPIVTTIAEGKDDKLTPSEELLTLATRLGLGVRHTVDGYTRERRENTININTHAGKHTTSQGKTTTTCLYLKA